jgi:hypothetical protein
VAKTWIKALVVLEVEGRPAGAQEGFSLGLCLEGQEGVTCRKKAEGLCVMEAVDVMTDERGSVLLGEGTFATSGVTLCGWFRAGFLVTLALTCG